MEHTAAHRFPEDAVTGEQGRPRLMLLLRAGSDQYAIDARQVAEVIMSVDLTPLGGAPQGVAGLVNHHGRMLPVVDLCRLTLGRDCNRLLSTRILMVRVTPEGLVGLRAEHVTDGVWVDPADLTCAEGGLGDAVYLRRMVGQRMEMISVLCLDRLLPELLRTPQASACVQEA